MSKTEDLDAGLQLEKGGQKFDLSLKNLRIADVELFLTAAHLKSLGRSAAFHHLSQSAASTAVQRVEAAFGLHLCTHEKRKFRLTREGQALSPQLGNWLRQLKELRVSKDPVPIRLVTVHSIAEIAVPALLALEPIDCKPMRPEEAYAAVLQGEADIAVVFDNSSWKGVTAVEVGRGNFQIYSSDPEAELRPVLLPEDQTEVLALQKSWQQAHGCLIPVKSRISSWSLIASICSESKEVGFLPDFLAKKHQLHPVLWQPAPFPYRVLALYRNLAGGLQQRLDLLVQELQKIF